MHLGNGAVTPECAALGLAAAAGGLGFCWRNLSKSDIRPELPKAIALGSLVFAAQMLNVPVLSTSSAHFVGGVLLAELLGPALGVVVMSSILLIQAALLGDGGLAALGVNIVNMALVPAGLLVLVKRSTSQRWLGLGVASIASIALAVMLIAGEVALGRAADQLADWPAFASTLCVALLPVLAMEAAMTVSLVLLWTKLSTADAARWRLAGGTLAAALLLLVAASFLSSDLPDGYESAAETAQMAWLLK